MINFRAKLPENMRKLILSAAIFFMSLDIFAQVAPYKYFIGFTDKNGSPYSVNNPEEFLTARSIQRRANQFITITEEDLPVNASYVNQVANTGVTVITRSRWFNGITIYTTDSTKLDVIAAFPFVRQIIKNKKGHSASQPVHDKSSMECSFLSVPFQSDGILKSSPNGFDYGPSFHQIHMLNGDLLHNQGFRGEGKVIAVLDAGFLQVDRLKAFDSLWQNNQILGTHDFVNPGSNVFEGHIHGMMVLSLIGGNYPGRIIGTAPKASFWLLRSEEANTEYLIEEYNWVCAAEYADSVGADIISSSLGYTTFKDPSTNHTCADMNGHTTPATLGANIASLKGMAVVCSAGNEGENINWRCLSTPAEGDNVLGIGSVDSLGLYASTSSVGTVNGDRVKPNVAAMGQKAVVFWTNDSIVKSSGTSFSCPQIAGMMACLWQARPDVTPARLYKSVEESSSHYTVPDSLTGYGIPDFNKAMNILSIPGQPISQAEVFPNPFISSFTIVCHSASFQKVKLQIYNGVGELVFQDLNLNFHAGENIIPVKNPGGFPQGIYLVRLQGESFSESFRVIKSGNQ
jgi:serine protease AprX